MQLSISSWLKRPRTLGGQLTINLLCLSLKLMMNKLEHGPLLEWVVNYPTFKSALVNGFFHGCVIVDFFSLFFKLIVRK